MADQRLTRHRWFGLYGVAQLANLTLKQSQNYTLENFREILGVQPGKYKSFGELNKHVIKPAVAELNALAPFEIALLPVKQGKKVVQVNIGWMVKDNIGLKAAFAELARSRVGRKARIAGTAEHVFGPTPSIERLARNGRKTLFPRIVLGSSDD